jgi:hypothetical protein
MDTVCHFERPLRVDHRVNDLETLRDRGHRAALADSGCCGELEYDGSVLAMVQRDGGLNPIDEALHVERLSVDFRRVVEHGDVKARVGAFWRFHDSACRRDAACPRDALEEFCKIN